MYLRLQLSPSVDIVYLSSHVVHFTTPEELRDATSQLSGYATKPSTSNVNYSHTHTASLTDAWAHSKECKESVIAYQNKLNQVAHDNIKSNAKFYTHEHDPLSYHVH